MKMEVMKYQLEKKQENLFVLGIIILIQLKFKLQSKNVVINMKSEQNLN